MNALLGIEALGALVIVWQSIEHFNRITRRTRLVVAAAWAALGGSAVWVFVEAMTGAHNPDARFAALCISVAALAITDRRRPR